MQDPLNKLKSIWLDNLSINLIDQRCRLINSEKTDRHFLPKLSSLSGYAKPVCKNPCQHGSKGAFSMLVCRIVLFDFFLSVPVIVDASLLVKGFYQNILELFVFTTISWTQIAFYWKSIRCIQGPQNKFDSAMTLRNLPRSIKKWEIWSWKS